MARPRILNIEPAGFAPEATAILGEVADVHEEWCDRAHLADILPGFDGLMMRFAHRIDADLLASAPRLKVIACPATGTDHIDHDAAIRHGVTVLSLKNDLEFLRSVTATAELTWGLLLMVVRRLMPAALHVRDGGWDRDRFQGMQLRGKTLGVIGYGRLGTMVARFGVAFGMRVLATDIQPRAAEQGVTMAPLDELIATSDILSLHVPLEPSTYGLLGRSEFGRMKRGMVLLNTSRGELIDEGALLQALDAGVVNGAGLDVLAGEGLKHADFPCGSEIWQRAQVDERIVLVPHIGGKTVDSNRDADIRIAEILSRFVSNSCAGI